jgi:DivIVA domain-containing protein
LLTREEIDKIQFSTTRLREGYDQDEVDSFLDLVGPTFDELSAKANRFEADNGTLRGEIGRLRSQDTAAMQIIQSPAPPASAERVLVLADETAQRHIAEAEAEAAKIRAEAVAEHDTLLGLANSEAGQIRAAARAEAAGVTNSAASEATTLVAVAEAERQRILNQLESERAELEEAIEQLKAKRANYKSWLRAALNKIEQEEIDA